MRLTALIIITIVATSLIVAADRRQVAVTAERNRVTLQDECRVACSRFDSELDNRLAVVRDLAAAIAIHPGIGGAEFRMLARSLSASHSSLESFHHLDLRGNALHAFSSSGRDGHTVAGDQFWAALLADITGDSEPVSRGPIPGTDGRPKLVVVAPVVSEGTSSGYAVGVHDLAVFVAEAFPDLDSGPFEISFRDARGDVFFGPSEHEFTHIRKRVAACGGLWEATMAWKSAPPGPDVATRLSLWAGGLLLLAALIILVHRLWWRAEWLDEAVAERTSELARANEALSSEVEDRRRAEGALERESELVSRIVKTSPVSIVVTDRDGRIILANTLARETLSVGGDITGLAHNAPEWRITDIDGRAFPEEQLPFFRVRSTGRAVYGIRHAIELPGGRRKLLSVNAAPLVAEDGEFDGIVAAVQDITESFEKDEKLRASEARYEQLFRSMSSGVAVYRAIDDGSDFMIVDFNDAARRIENVSMEEVVGRKVTEAFPGVVKFGLLDVMKRVWKSGRPEEHPISEYTDGRISGWRCNRVHKLSTGEIVAVYDDLTEKKKAEEQIELLARLPRENPNPVLRISRDMKVVYANDAAEELLGESVVGNEAPDDFREPAERVMSSGSAETVEWESDGRSFLLDFAPVAKFGYVNVYAIDITRMKGARG